VSLEINHSDVLNRQYFKLNSIKLPGNDESSIAAHPHVLVFQQCRGQFQYFVEQWLFNEPTSSFDTFRLKFQNDN
jgi:hypothetical protein